MRRGEVGGNLTETRWEMWGEKAIRLAKVKKNRALEMVSQKSPERSACEKR